MRTAQKSAYNIIFGLLGQLITIGIGVLLPRLFIMSYGSEINGFISSVNQILTYLVLLELGVGAATRQALYGPIEKDDHAKIAGIMSATNLFYKKTSMYYLIGVLVLAGLYPLVVHSDISVFLQVLIILIVGSSGVVSYYFQAKYKLLLQSEGKQYVLSNVSTIVHLITSVAKLVMISLGLSIVLLQLAQLVLTIGQSVYYSHYIRKHYPWLSLDVEPDNAAISQKNFALLHEISWMVFNHTDVLLLTLLLQDLKIVSVYVLYNTLIEMVATLISNIHSGFFYRLGQLFNSSRERHDGIFDIYETYYTAFSFAMYTVTYVHLLPFMRLYTAGITDTNYLLPSLPFLFVFYKALISARNSCIGLLSYAGKFRETRWHALVEALVNLIVTIAGILVFERLWGCGIYGALAGTIAALLVRFFLAIPYANRKILHRSCFRTYGKCILNAVLMIGLSVLYQWAKVPVENYGSLFLSAGAFAAISTIVFFCVNSLIYRDNAKIVQEYIRNIIHHWRNR